MATAHHSSCDACKTWESLKCVGCPSWRAEPGVLLLEQGKGLRVSLLYVLISSCSLVKSYKRRCVGEAIEHNCLKFLSRDLTKGQKRDVWFTDSERNIHVGDKFIKGIGNKLYLLQLFSKYCKYSFLICTALEWHLLTNPGCILFPMFLYTTVYMVLTLEQPCWPFMLYSCIIAL